MKPGHLTKLFGWAAWALAFAACSGSNGSNGQNGKSCTIQVDGGATLLVCQDGTSVVLPKGITIPTSDAGTTSCTISSPSGGAQTLVCPDGTTYVLPTAPANPVPAANCSVVSNGDGTSSMTCPSGDGGMVTVTVRNALSNFANLSAAEMAALDLNITLTSVTIPTSGKPVITFKAIDRASGNAISGLPPSDMRFALLKLVPATNGGNDTWVSYMAANATSVPGTETAAATATATSGALADNGDGTYVYTFAKNVTDATNAGTTYDANATHRFAMQVSQSLNGLQVFAPVNVVKDFVPATGADVTGENDKVNGASCLECHSSFRAPAGGTGAFHGGTRYDVRYCVACHNDQQRYAALPGTGAVPNVDLDAPGVVDPTTGKWNGNAWMINGQPFLDLPVWIHKIHKGDQLTLTGGQYTGIAMPYTNTYPQDLRNCAKCHNTVAMATNFSTKPSQRACGACHDSISFLAPPPAGRKFHPGGSQSDDSMCVTCHASASTLDDAIPTLVAHVPIALPDPTATNYGGTNTHTNQGWIPAAGVLPAGAAKITYQIKSVTRDANKHPSIVFQFQKTVPPATTATPVVFNSPGASTGVDGGASPDGGLGSAEMMDGFVNSPSVYFAYAVPQDSIKAPADFNVTVSAYIKAVWNKTAASTGTMTGPDASGYYTITLTATVPDNAVMLTGGIGYSYGTSSNQPLTEIDLTAFPYGDSTVVSACATGQICGGLIVAATDVSMVATGYTARRPIVNNSTCIMCHEQLGANPSFHAGQRNDASTCAFCHNANLSDSGWSVGSSTFIHGIHAASKRTVPYTWQATCPTGTTFAAGTCTTANADSYAKVTYPGILSNCQQCHLPGTYDFSATASASALPNLLMSTVGTGTYTPAITNSPYVTADGRTDYGTIFSTSSLTSGTKNGVACTTTAPCVCTLAAPCEASSSTLVKSPITAACSACHDSPNEIKHMQSMGGTFYGTRLSAMANSEMCMMCHGPGTVAAIADVHK